MNWKATLTALLALSCSVAMSQNYLMNASTTSITTCSGFFMDSGGGNNNYGPNQNFTTTICPNGTTGTHIQLVFTGTQISSGDNLCFFDGNNANAPSLGCASDFGSSSSYIIQATAANSTGCLTLTFTSNFFFQAAGWSASISCIPSCQLIEAILATSNPAAVPADTGWIDICPGTRVFFTGKGNYPQNGVTYNHSDLTSNFEWDFGDGVITYGPNVSHVFDEHGGYVVQLTITDQYGCKNTNSISQRVRVAPRPHFNVGDYPAQICAGDTVHLNSMIDSIDMAHTVSVTPAESGFQTLGVRSDSLPLPDGDGSSYKTTISFSDFAPGQVLTNINDLLGIWVNMEHSWMRDLQIMLTCPNGQSAILHNHAGQIGGEVFLGIPYEADEGFPVPVPGVGWDYGWSSNPDYNYTWIAYANAFLPQTLPSGSYNSFQPLSNFLGCPLNGDWEIQVTDLWPIDNGYIFSWSIDFNPALYPDIEMFSPALTSWEWNNHPSIYYTTPDSISGSPVNAGQVAYTFTVHDDFGCAWDTTVNIQVLPFTHPNCHSCQDILAPLADTTVCTGEPVLLDAFAPVLTNAPVTFESYDNYPVGAGNHPPANPYNSIIKVNSIIPATITSVSQDIVSVCLDFETDFDADIQIFLRAPNNQLLMLSTNNGGSGDHYKQTCFTPTAVVPITAGTPPFTGNFLPEGNWAVLNNAPVNGDWTLRISDAFGLNSYGKLNWWSITFRSKNNITYTWTPPASLTCNNCPSPTATPSSSTNYIVSATDSYGCSSKDTVEVAVLNSFPAPAVTCGQQAGGEILVNWNDISPGLGYEININNGGWQAPNNGTLSHIVTGLNNGSVVNVQVRADVNGVACAVSVGTSSCTYAFCPITATPVQAGPYAVSCFGVCDESIQIDIQNGTAPYNFDITNQTSGNTNSQTSDVLANLCPGNYQVIVTDDTGCKDTVNFMVGQPAAISVSANQVSGVTCNGGNDGCAMAMATGGTAPVSYVWGNPNMSIGQNVCTLPAGLVTVTATDANGCQAASSVTITQPSAITMTFTKTDVKCLGGNSGTATVNPTGGTGTYTYQWSAGTNPSQKTNTGLAQGIYSVTVQDINGCQAFGNVTIGQPSTAVQVTAAQTVMSCFGQNKGSAMATPSGGTGPYTFLWTPSGQTTQTATNLMPGAYTVVATDANGCTASNMVSTQQWDQIAISISDNPPTCSGMTDGELGANIVTGGNGIYSYLWNTGATTDFINGLPGGLTYTVTVTDSQGCTGSGSRFLAAPAAIIVSTTAVNAKCNGSADGTATVTNVQNAKGMVTYQWDAAAQNQTTSTAIGLTAGTYTVVVTDTSGCTGSEIAVVQQPTGMTTQFQTIDNKCYGEQKGAIDMSVSGGAGNYTFLWSNGGTTAKLTNILSGNYLVTITDANGCTKIDSILVKQPAAVNALLTIKDPACFGDKNGAISINPQGGTPPFTYSLNGTSFFGSSTLIALASGDYTVYLKDGKGCVLAVPATVNEPLQFSVNILTDGLDLDEHMLNFGDSVLLTAQVTNGVGTLMYTWNAAWCSTLFCNGLSDCDQTPLCNAVWSKPDYSNDYFLLVVDGNGCEAEDHLQVHVKKERRVVVPTGFTPNDDGLNDRLPVHGKSGSMIRLFRVFDRWGELLFEQLDFPINDLTMGWDGNFKNKMMPGGVYVWYLEVEYEDGMKDSLKGETTLIR